jgi:hypothetical protein
VLLVKREKARTKGNEDSFSDVGGSNRVTSRLSLAAANLHLYCQVGIRSGVVHVGAKAQIQLDRTSSV